MNLERITLPPVSKKFYDTLVERFPPLDPLDIKEDTPMIYIQRRAAQQEIIRVIAASVKETEVKEYNNIWDKFRNLVHNK
jgi:hypothetical protein